MSSSKAAVLVCRKWVDRVLPVLGGVLGLAPVYALGLLYYAGSPQNTDVGYRPEQPVPYSHALHVGELGIDCKYCHNTVEVSAHASLPATEVCMNCHSAIYPESAKLLPVRESFASGLPVKWVRVHDLPDYAYFNHSAHVNRGVGCVSCHGRIDKMEVVYQSEPLSMGWCLDCHRNPEPNLRPLSEITNMDWQAPGDPFEFGRQIRTAFDLNPNEDCSTCHR